MSPGNVAFVVFMLPVILSLSLGSFVLGEVLQEPDRDLNMWPFDTSTVSSGAIKISGLEKEYSTSEPIEIGLTVSDPAFDCGDLYITIYDLGQSPKEVVSQNGFFDQCFEKNNGILPVDDEFSETVSAVGQYEIHIEINDKNNEKTITANERFVVK